MKLEIILSNEIKWPQIAHVFSNLWNLDYIYMQYYIQYILLYMQYMLIFKTDNV